MKDVWLGTSTQWERPRGWQQLSGLYTHTHLDPRLKGLREALPLPPLNLVKTWKVLINPFLFISNLYPASFQKECKAAQINLLKLQWQEPAYSLLAHLPWRSTHLTPPTQTGEKQGANAGGRWHPTRPFPSFPACLLLPCFLQPHHAHAGLCCSAGVAGTKDNRGKLLSHSYKKVYKWNQINSSFGGRMFV